MEKKENETGLSSVEKINIMCNMKLNLGVQVKAKWNLPGGNKTVIELLPFW